MRKQWLCERSRAKGRWEFDALGPFPKGNPAENSEKTAGSAAATLAAKAAARALDFSLVTASSVVTRRPSQGSSLVAPAILAKPES
jgi:hypothetical protein